MPDEFYSAPPALRHTEKESARQSPNLDGALPTNVLANTFTSSLPATAGHPAIRKKIRLRNPQPAHRIVESPLNLPRTLARDVSRSILLPRSWQRLPPVTRRRKIPNHFVKPKAIEFTRIAEARNGRTKFNRNGRSSDSFRPRRLPDPKSQWQESVAHIRPATAEREHTAAGTVRDSHPIPI